MRFDEIINLYSFKDVLILHGIDSVCVCVCLHTFFCVTVKNSKTTSTVAQLGATTLIWAKTLTVLSTIAFAPSVQMTKQWKWPILPLYFKKIVLTI